jgi:hypothetical protein
MFQDAGLVQPTFDAMETAVLQLIGFFEPVFQTVDSQTFVVVVR